MKFKHFFKESEMSQEDVDGLRVLLDQCDIIRRKQILEVVDQGDYKSVVCVYDDYGKMCGFAAVVLEYGYINLNVLYVDEGQRRKGYGKGLIKEVKAFANHMGVDTVELIALEYRKSALRLYEKTGFVYTSVRNCFTSEMRMYVNSSAYVVGGVLNAISRKYGPNNLAEGLKECRSNGDLSVFDGAFKKDVSPKVLESVLQRRVVESCAKCLDRMGDSLKAQDYSKRLFLYTAEASYKKSFVDRVLPGLSRESAHEFASYIHAYYAFRNQDKICPWNKESNRDK